MDEKEKVIDLTVDKDGVCKEESKFKTRLRNFKDGAKRRISAGWKWCVDNKADLIILVPLGLATATKVKREFFPQKMTSVTARERDRVDRNYYDPTTGVNWTLKRPLRNYEKEELLRRRRSGEFTEEILRDMRVLER